jgi:hypothetical protein
MSVAMNQLRTENVGTVGWNGVVSVAVGNPSTQEEYTSKRIMLNVDVNSR